jgi:hypothetical protein
MALGECIRARECTTIAAMRTPVLVRLVVPLALACGPFLSAGCDKEQKKSAPAAGSASTSAAPAVVTSVDAAPDPKEAKYAKLRKDLKDKNLAYVTSLQKIYGGTGKDEETTWKAYFPKSKEGQKEADDIFKEAAFTGKEGMSITSFEVSDVSFDEKLLRCTADVSEKQMQRGKPRCVIYKLQWEEQSGSWVRTAKTDLNIVPCP